MNIKKKLSNLNRTKILTIILLFFAFVFITSPAFAAVINGNIYLQNTTSSTTGVILKGGSRFIHDYSKPGSDGENIFIGKDAGNFTMGPGGGASDLGSFNNTLGAFTLTANTTGNSNDAIGWGALNSNTTGSYNEAMGDSALYENTTGHDNTALGNTAMTTNTTGSFNVGIGASVLGSNTTGSNNTVVGDAALPDLNITANDGSGANTVLGYWTGQGLVTGINNTIIGANVSGLAAGLSNNIIIADGAGNQRINVDATGNVGIGTNVPDAKLHIKSDSFILETPKTPASSSSTCKTGMIAWDTSYIYLCIAANTWHRSAHATW